MGRDGEGYKVIWAFGKPEYFFKWGWTRCLKNCLSGKSVNNSDAPQLSDSLSTFRPGERRDSYAVKDNAETSRY